MRLLAFDPYPSTAALDLGVEYVDLQTLFAESDVISALPAHAGKLPFTEPCGIRSNEKWRYGH